MLGTDYLTGDLLTLLLPVGLVAVVAVYWVLRMRRNPK